MKKISLKASGKINLTLDILGKRPDGYHNVEMVMQSIELADIITLTETPSVVRVDSDKADIPTGMGNITLRAAYFLKDLYNIKAGVDIHIEKRIPIAAGLAGGSTDCAAVLIGLNELWSLNLSRERLREIGSSLGADVPFCLLGGTALARGIGEILIPWPSVTDIWVVLIKPDAVVSTADIYNSINLKAISYRPDYKGVYEALLKKDFNALKQSMGNVMETVTAKRYLVIDSIKEQLLMEGARASMMTGSGPAVFGLFDNRDIAERAYNSLRIRHSEVYITQFTAEGIKMFEGGITVAKD